MVLIQGLFSPVCPAAGWIVHFGIFVGRHKVSGEMPRAHHCSLRAVRSVSGSASERAVK